MDDYLYHTAPYAAYAHQMMHHPYSIGSSHSSGGFLHHGGQINQVLRHGSSMERFGPAWHSPPGLIVYQQPVAMADAPLAAAGYRPSGCGTILNLKKARYAGPQDDRPLKRHGKEEGGRHRERMSEEEMAEEVALLHNLWNRGEQDSSGGGSKEQRWRHKGKTLKYNKRKANDNDSLLMINGEITKDAAESSWEVSSDHLLGQHNASWGQLPEKNEEPKKMESPEQGDIAKYRLAREQKAALKIVTEFLEHESDIEGSDEDTDEDGELDYPDIVVEINQALEITSKAVDHTQGREEKACIFFLRLFDENQELRKAYEECCNCGGDFECLICAGTGSHKRKKYLNLVGLVQHARKVLRTKRKPEHRGYGRAICSLLGWDPSRDPVMPRTVLAARGCIPPSEECLQEDDENGTGKRDIADVRPEVEDENKTSDIGCTTPL